MAADVIENMTNIQDDLSLGPALPPEEEYHLGDTGEFDAPEFDCDIKPNAQPDQEYSLAEGGDDRVSVPNRPGTQSLMDRFKSRIAGVVLTSVVHTLPLAIATGFPRSDEGITLSDNGPEHGHVHITLSMRQILDVFNEDENILRLM